MKFDSIKNIWVTNFGLPDISFGIHICMDKRIDIHFLWWMFSFGKIPIYKDDETFIAVSNSFHNKRSKRLRAGTP